MQKNQNESIPLQNASVKKLVVIIGFLILLLIPIAFVENTVNERQNYRAQAVSNVVKAWAKPQIIKLPTLEVSNGSKIQKLPLLYLDAQAKINSEIRKKGIFKIPVYTAKIKITGSFTPPAGNLDGTLIFPVLDARGYSKNPSIKIDSLKTPDCKDNFCKFHIQNSNKPINFVAEYIIKGTNFIQFEVGSQMFNLKTSGNWPNPAFEGDFLPESRNVSVQGFSADWAIPNIASAGSEKPLLCTISLLTPVDSYRMTIRTIKYAFLFLALTFLAFFIFEITSKNAPIHPFQYGLIGLSMIIFYLLLISISEFLPFAAAYLIASSMTILSITGYTHFVLTRKTNNKFVALTASILALLYTYLYTILNLQDFSLLLGSLGIFFAVLIVMYATRNVQWYRD